MLLRDEDLEVHSVVNKPKSGQWHCGPNSSWIIMTHIPTGVSITAFAGTSGQDAPFKVRENMKIMIQMLIENIYDDQYFFKENLC